jgi:hypothetical protein
MKTIYKIVWLCVLPLLTLARTPENDPCNVEKKKTILKVYDVDANDNLLIDNQFGQVSVALWDKPEIRVQVVITASSSTDERAQRTLDGVEIEDKRNGNQIVVKTHLNKSGGQGWNFGNGDKPSSLRIDYLVSMPHQNALSVRNKFGNTNIPAFQAPLTIYERYGNFTADQLGNQNDIDVAYGKADIGTMDVGKLDISYSNLVVSKVNMLTLVNKFGKMTIGDVGRLDANIGYSGAKIGTLREWGKIKLDFSGGFQIAQLKSADNVDIKSSYSSVALPLDDNTGYDFDVTVHYGNFSYGNNQPVKFTLQPEEDDKRGPKFTKQYVGKIGKGSGPRVKVVSSFGNVNFR